MQFSPECELREVRSSQRVVHAQRHQDNGSVRILQHEPIKSSVREMAFDEDKQEGGKICVGCGGNN